MNPVERNPTRHPIRIAAGYCLALPGLAGGGCASSSMPAVPSSAPLPPHKDGVYVGRRTVQSGGAGCGLDDDVSYQVQNSRVWLRTHRTRRFIDGQIEPDGRFTMLNQAGTDQISGSISGDRLFATETSAPRHGRHSDDRFAESPCVAQIEARYVTSPPTTNPD